MDTKAPIEERLLGLAARTGTGPKAAAVLREAAVEITRLRADLDALAAARLVIGSTARRPAAG